MFRAERTEGEKFHQTFIAYMFLKKKMVKKAPVNAYSNKAFCLLHVLKKNY